MKSCGFELNPPVGRVGAGWSPGSGCFGAFWGFNPELGSTWEGA